MSLDDYKKLKATQVDYFFRGINFESIGKNGKEFPLVDKNLIIDGNLYNIDYINSSKNYRRVAQSFLVDLKSLGYEFFHTDLCFSNSIAEVDMAVNKLVVNIMKRLEAFKLEVMDDFHSKLDKKSRLSFQIPELNFINIKIGDKVFSWLRSGNRSLENEIEVFDELRPIMHMICFLPELEKIEIKRYQEAKQKKDELCSMLMDLSKYLDIGTPAYKRVAQNYQKLYKSRNIEEIFYLFEQTVDYISQVTGIDLEELKEQIRGSSDKPKRTK